MTPEQKQFQTEFNRLVQKHELFGKARISGFDDARLSAAFAEAYPNPSDYIDRVYGLSIERANAYKIEHPDIVADRFLDTSLDHPLATRLHQLIPQTADYFMSRLVYLHRLANEAAQYIEHGISAKLEMAGKNIPASMIYSGSDVLTLLGGTDRKNALLKRTQSKSFLDVLLMPFKAPTQTHVCQGIILVKNDKPNKDGSFDVTLGWGENDRISLTIPTNHPVDEGDIIIARGTIRTSKAQEPAPKGPIVHLDATDVEHITQTSLQASSDNFILGRIKEIKTEYGSNDYIVFQPLLGEFRLIPLARPHGLQSDTVPLNSIFLAAVNIRQPQEPSGISNQYDIEPLTAERLTILPQRFADRLFIPHV